MVSKIFGIMITIYLLMAQEQTHLTQQCYTELSLSSNDSDLIIDSKNL